MSFKKDKSSLLEAVDKIYQEKKSGYLTLSGKYKIFIHFENGSIVNFEEWDTENNFLTFLLASEFLSKKQLSQLREAQRITFYNGISLLIGGLGFNPEMIKKAYQAYFNIRMIEFQYKNHQFNFVGGNIETESVLKNVIDTRAVIQGLSKISDNINEILSIIHRDFFHDIEVIDRTTGLIKHSILINYVNTKTDFYEFLIFIKESKKSGKIKIIRQNSPQSFVFRIISAAFSILFLASLLFFALKEHDRDLKNLHSSDIIEEKFIQKLNKKID